MEQRNLLRWVRHDSGIAGGGPEGIAVGDFKQDGYPDLATANSTNSPATAGVLLGNATPGSFPSSTQWSAGSGFDAEAVAMGRFRSLSLSSPFIRFPYDDLAVAVSNSNDALANGYVAVLLGNPDGTFQEPATILTVQRYPLAVAVGDFNGDGKTDIAAANFTSKTISTFLGNGNGTFQGQVVTDLAPIGNPDTPFNLAVGDFNGDGKADLAVGAAGNSPVLHVLLSNGDGSFNDAHQYSLPGFDGFSVGVAVGDFDGDGKLDAALTQGNDGAVYSFKGNGDGTFQAPRGPFAVGTVPVYIVVGQFNNDGKLDLAVVNSFSDDVSILYGNGDTTFTLNTTLPINGGAAAAAILHYTPGLDSVAVADETAGIVAVYVNTGAGPRAIRGRV